MGAFRSARRFSRIIMASLLLAMGFGAALAPAATASTGALHVIPFPGTPDAAPGSRIIFSSLRPSELRRVAVRGSRTGPHTGRLVALPPGSGTAFAPSQPFAPGERVAVTAALNSPNAGTASGEPGATRLQFSFTVAVPGAGPSAAARAAPDTGPSKGPNMFFRSQVDFHPPLVPVSSDPDSTSGDIFLTPHNSTQSGPMILDSTGHLIWFAPAKGMGAFNLEKQSYHGQPVLTWWQGTLLDGHGINGQDVILDSSYRTVAVLKAGDGYSSDLHEFQISPQGTALIDAYVPVHYNLSRYGGSSNGTVLDCVIQELNISTGKVLWEWHALGHIPLSDSHKSASGSGPFDYFHLNSIQATTDGNLLISARNTWGIYKINKSNGSVMWELGGKHPTFKMGPGTGFEWQHDARIFPQEVLTLFNDAGVPQEESQSSGMRLQINTRTNTVSLTRRYTHSPPVLAGGEGNMQTLPNGNVVVGWGSTPEFSEYTADGRQIFTGRFLIPVNSYRAYRFPWSGQPLTSPSLALAPQSNGDLKIYASWNGATRVARWKVLGGPDSGTLRWFDTTARTGFETVPTLHSEPRYLAVQALDSSGHVLGTSPTHPDPAHVAIFGPHAFVPRSGGYGAIPVGCFTGHDCKITLKLSAGRSVIGQGTQTVAPATGRLVYFTLSSSGQSQLAQSSSHRLQVQASIRDSSGATATRSMTLIPYAISGSAPSEGVTDAPSIQIARTNSFVASGGLGSILSACYAQQACHPRATVTVRGQVIGATTRRQHLGAQELGDVYFRLNQTGQSMLAHASGNQLGAQIKLTNAGATATGQIDLIGYH